MKALPCFIKSNKMKNLIIVLSVFLTAITSVSAQKATKQESPETIYVCPTHPRQDESKLR
jgi:hypothetical protein